MSTEHIAKAFDTDLQALARMIAEMGGLAERQISRAIEALEKRDAVLAQAAIADDT